MKKITSKTFFYFLLGAVVFGLGAYFINSTILSKKSSIPKNKSSVESTVNTVIPAVVESPSVNAVNFVDVPLSAVLTHFYDTTGLSVLPGRHASALVTLSGVFRTKLKALIVLRSALEPLGLELVGENPYVVHEKIKEPDFVPVQTGSSGGKLFILHGSTWYPVSDFPYMLRRSANGTFQAAIPAVQLPPPQVPPGSVATVGKVNI